MWCCRHETLGCSSLQQSVDAPSKAFNCQQGFQTDWSEVKRNWCCTNLQLGCSTGDQYPVPQLTPAPTPFQAMPPGSSARIWNCFNGLAGSWSKEKKEWCCQNEQQGCGSVNPFDCQTGVSNWEAEWSSTKKSWCCTHDYVGCPPQLNMRLGKKFEQGHRHRSDVEQHSRTSALALLAGCATVAVSGVALFSCLRAQRLSGYSMVQPDAGSGSGPDF